MNKHTFISRRPTDVEALQLHRSEAEFHEIARDFVTGWDNVTENDIVGGGGSDAVAFDKELWNEWCNDRPDFWRPIASAVLDAYTLHSKRLQDAEKNSQAG